MRTAFSTAFAALAIMGAGIVVLGGEPTSANSAGAEDRAPSLRELVRTRPDERIIAAGRRRVAFGKLLYAPTSLAREVNLILKDRKLREADPDAVIKAAKVAAVYRLRGCIPKLLQVITLKPKPKMEDYFSHSITLEEISPIAYALCQIGKPAIPHVLNLACSREATAGELAAAGRVLEGVEGDIARHVVESFIAKSKNPKETRQLLMRKPFRYYWVPKQPVPAPSTEAAPDPPGPRHPQGGTSEAPG